MSENYQIVEQLNYKVKEIPLGTILTDKKVIIGSKIVYILNVPISTSMRLNKKGNDSFSANTVQIIKAPKGQVIEYLFLTTLETSTTPMSIFLSDDEIFSDIGIEDRAVLVDSDGIEYDARLRNSLDGTMFTQAITTIQTYTSSALDFSKHDKINFCIHNESDVSITVQFEGSNNGITYHDVGDPLVVGATTGKDIASLTDAWKYLRVTFTNTVLGTTGSCIVLYTMK